MRAARAFTARARRAAAEGRQHRRVCLHRPACKADIGGVIPRCRVAAHRLVSGCDRCARATLAPEPGAGEKHDAEREMDLGKRRASARRRESQRGGRACAEWHSRPGFECGIGVLTCFECKHRAKTKTCAECKRNGQARRPSHQRSARDSCCGRLSRSPIRPRRPSARSGRTQEARSSS